MGKKQQMLTETDKKKGIKVSVLVPVYNVERYLSQCLDSLTNQSLKEIEIICVNDGSTDHSSSILDEYAEMDERIIVIHKENTGYGHTMNVALDHAQGDYIAIVESDDFAEPEMLEKLYTGAISHQVDVVKANLYHYRKGKDFFCDRLHGLPYGCVVKIDEYPIILRMADSIWSGLYRREYLLKKGIRFHETPGASFQDISFAMQVWLNGENVLFLEDAVIHYRMDNTSSSIYSNKKAFCFFDEYSFIEKEVFQKQQDGTDVLSRRKRYYYHTKYQDSFDHYRYHVAAPYQFAFLMRLKEEIVKDQQDSCFDESVFTSEELRNLDEICGDMYTYYEKTGKVFQDFRLNIIAENNRLSYVEGFIDVIRKKTTVIIYGAGKIGQKLGREMIKRNCHVDYFLVTQKANEQEKVLDIPVIELTDLKNFSIPITVIIAISEKNQMTLYENLQTIGIKDIYLVDQVVSLLWEGEE